MKEINQYILEKLKINKDIKVNKMIDDIDLNENESIFSTKDIDTIIEYANKLKVIPIALSNKVFFTDKLFNDSNSIYLYFSKDWRKVQQKNYLYILKMEQDESYHPAQCYNGELDYLKDSKDNYISGDIETACNAFIDDLDPKFYKSLNK